MYLPEVISYVKRHRLDKLFEIAADKTSLSINAAVDPTHTEPFAADWDDLVRLHRFAIERKATTILEFGVGKSSVIFAHALNENRERHGQFVRDNLRRNNPFELHSVDDMEGYIAATKKAAPSHLADICHFHFSPVSMSTFNDRICTFYDTLPNICPDLIYLDGPSQSSVRGSVRGISTDHPDRLPMAADLLAMEHFLLPGTLIVVDGRTANARFLKANFQRSWCYNHDPEGDVHLFELCEKPLGIYNHRQIEYCLGKDWIERASTSQP